jgi:hypothetical protein
MNPCPRPHSLWTLIGGAATRCAWQFARAAIFRRGQIRMDCHVIGTREMHVAVCVSMRRVVRSCEVLVCAVAAYVHEVCC